MVEKQIIKPDEVGTLNTILNNISPIEMAKTDHNMWCAAQLADYMELKGFTNESLAEKMGTIPSTVEYWLSGASNYPLPLLFDITTALGISLKKFLCTLPDVWHKISETNLPEQGVEMIFFNKDWIDEDFNPRGLRVGFLGGDGYITAHWWDYQDTYMTISKMDCEGDGFSANIKNSINPTHWKEMGDSPVNS